jgi:pimeloyl-ACP methyl ester carboxylesterase
MSRRARLRGLVLLLALAGCTPSEPPAAPAQATAREARVRSLAGDGTSIRYRVHGRGEPAIVFIHGWSCDSGYWDAQLDHFAANHAVITLDLAGHGQSPGQQRTDWSIAAFGADVAAVVADSGAGRVVLVGSSMGGPVALEAARRLPGQVVGIVGVDTFREIATPLPQELWDGLVGQMRADFAGSTAAFVGENFFTGRTDPVLKRWIIEDMAAAPPEVAIPAVVALADYDDRPALAELDVPVIAINSSGSPTDEPATRRIEPRFRLVELHGVGHFPMLEDPATFNRVLERIVAEWVALEPQRNPLSATPGNR